MATGALIVGIVATAAAATTTAIGQREQRKANKAQRKITAERRQMEQMERQAEARERYRALRRERASAVQNIEYLGASESTSAQSAVGGTQTAYNVGQGFANTTGAMADRINAWTDQYQKHNYKAQQWGSWTNTFGSLAGASFSTASLMSSSSGGSGGGSGSGSGGGSGSNGGGK